MVCCNESSKNSVSNEVLVFKNQNEVIHDPLGKNKDKNREVNLLRWAAQEGLDGIEALPLRERVTSEGLQKASRLGGDAIDLLSSVAFSIDLQGLRPGKDSLAGTPEENETDKEKDKDHKHEARVLAKRLKHIGVGGSAPAKLARESA